jgi:hypothetical protein
MNGAESRLRQSFCEAERLEAPCFLDWYQIAYHSGRNPRGSSSAQEFNQPARRFNPDSRSAVDLVWMWARASYDRTSATTGMTRSVLASYSANCGTSSFCRL